VLQPTSVDFKAANVRSRTITGKDGHLFLATVTDGAILEFEPLSP
jgi:hypothetical protein